MDLAVWLRGLGLERYEAAFRDNESPISPIGGASTRDRGHPARLILKQRRGRGGAGVLSEEPRVSGPASLDEIGSEMIACGGLPAAPKSRQPVRARQ
jgi:hypothetical protein